MIREDTLAGLFVPVEMLLVGAPDGGTTLTYVSNLLAKVLDAPAVLRAGVELLLTLSGSLLEIKGYPNGLVSKADDLALLKVEKNTGKNWESPAATCHPQ
jgi:hypothetical protein